MKRLFPILAGVAIFLSGLCPAAAAILPLPLDGHWVKLDEVMRPGTFFGRWTSPDLTPWEYTFNSPDSVLFTITDWAVVSDRFEVYDNGGLVPILTTPLMPDWPALGAGTSQTSPPYTLDPDVALASGDFSSGTILFAPGAHSITIRDIHIPEMDNGQTYSDGTVAFKATVVPEPASLAIWSLTAGLSFAGLGSLRRRKNKTVDRGRWSDENRQAIVGIIEAGRRR